MGQDNLIYTPGTREKSNNSHRFTQAQRDFYETNGFLVVPGLVEPDLLDACEQRFLDIINGRIEKGSIVNKFVKVINTKKWMLHYSGTLMLLEIDTVTCLL